MRGFRQIHPLAAFFSGALWASASFASCPLDDWIATAPECPAGDNTILPANYPSAAYVVSSDIGGDKKPTSQDFAASTVLEILKNSGERLPMILIPASNAEFQHVKSQVRAFASAHPEFAKADQWSKSLVQAGKEAYTWQQDYFESFFNPATGKPVLREVDVYRTRRGIHSERLFQDLVAGATGSCPEGIHAGETLEKISPSITKNDAAFFGGNIEGLPGGLCLHGDNQPEDYARQYCGSQKNETVIPTRWLAVGHVDEITGVIKDPSQPPPCDFAITMASPELAIKLLRENPNAPFFSFYATGDHAGTDLKYRASDLDGAGDACTWVREAQAQKSAPSPVEPEQSDPQKGGAGRGAWLSPALKNLLHLFWERDSIAGGKLVSHGPVPASGLPNIDCAKITNGQVAEALLKVDRARINNQLIQMKMDEARAKIQAKLYERLPQCKPRFIELPQIFRGSPPVEIRGAPKDAPLDKRYELSNNSQFSVLPNAANALVVGNSVLSPHPQNSTFAKYMDQAYAQAGLKNVFIDTYDYAHVKAGNLHCSTHSIPVCKPKESQ